jgi:hypothetical protein
VCGSVAQDFYKISNTTCGYYFHQNGQAPETPLAHGSPNINDVLRTFQPTKVIIELGTNYAPNPYWNYSTMIADMKPLLDQVAQSGARCFWVSMPDTRTYRSRTPDILQATQDAVSSTCVFINSTRMTSYPENAGGGVHYNTPETIPIAKSWAEQVYSVVESF